MNTEIESLIKKVEENLEKSHEHIHSKMVEFNRLVSEQAESFVKITEKLKPILTFLKENKYPFYSKIFDCHSFLGPVIGREGNTLFVWEHDIYLIKYDMYTEEREVIVLHSFFRSHSYKDAVTSLLDTVNILDDKLNEAEELVDQKRNELNIVHEMLEEK